MKRIRVMYLGGTWGDAMYYFDDDHKRIYGFKNRVNNAFSDGSVMFDLANHKNDDNIPLYLITDIKFEDDPADMFYANISLLGNVKNPHKGSGGYNDSWYKPYIGEILDEYKNKLKRLSFFKREEKKFLKMAVFTLQLMADN